MLFTKNWLLKKAWSGTAVALAAQLGTFPITLYYFHQFPNYFLITNLGLMVFSVVLLGVGLGFIVVGALPWIAPVVAVVLSLIVSGLILFIQWINDLPFSVTKGIQIEPWEVWLIYLMIGLLLWSFVMGRQRIFKAVVLFSFIGIFVQTYNYHEKFFRKEVILLNASSPTFFMRDGKQAALVVFSKRANIAEKMEFQRKSLETFYGAQIELIVVDFDHGELEHESIRITKDKSLVRIEAGNVYTLVTNNYFAMDQLTDSDQLIVGNWVSPVQIETLKRNFEHVKLLKDGAITLR
jgi:competence protein ComEC